MYESPIEMIITDIQHQIVQQQDEQIYKAVVNFIPNVDKDELLRALQYDRDQYEKGYQDGKMAAMDELVRCKDCKHGIWDEEEQMWECVLPVALTGDRDTYSMFREYNEGEHFCSYGERKDNG